MIGRPLALFFSVLGIVVWGPLARSETISMPPFELRCEQRRDPLGIDVKDPRLSWVPQTPNSNARGLWQDAYQILAASSADLLARDQADLWDSGRVPSDSTQGIVYAGKPLESSWQVFWKVRVWIGQKNPATKESSPGPASDWSKTGIWTMGLLSADDWQAKWIGSADTESRPPPAKTIGYHAGETKKESEVKWVQVDLGKPCSIESVNLIPMVHQEKAGFGFPLRFKVEASVDSDFRNPLLIADETSSDFPNPGAKPAVFSARNLTARYVRVTTTRLWPRGDGFYSFALRQLMVVAAGKNIAFTATPAALDSVENFGWGLAGLTDGAPSSGAVPESLLLRREFNVKPGLRRAVVFISGLGQYEMSMNGNKVGEELLTPGWTDYRKTVLYDTYDVTSRLKEGTNAAGFLLGNGMYDVEKSSGRNNKFVISLGPRKAIARIQLEYTDGTMDQIRTDDQWKTCSGPLTYSNVYGGEEYDARLEPKGWSQAGFNDQAWKQSAILPGPGGELRGLSVANPPIHTFEVFKPVSSRELRPGVTVYDMGQNASVMPRLTVKGPAGSTLRIIPGELLFPDGSVNQASGGGPCWWQYTLSGNGTEPYFPKFYYRGSRYQQVEIKPAPGNNELPVIESIESVVIHADSPAIGTFSSSNELFNRIWTLVRWAQRSNMVSVLTDCPHREKLGWLEQDYLNGPALRYNFDMDPLFSKVMNDMADSQRTDGFVPNIAPEYVRFGGDIDSNPFRNSPEWGCAYLFVAWQQYLFSGDPELLRVHYEGMKRYVAYLDSRAKDHILDFGLGDWFDIGPGEPGPAKLTPKALTGTAIYFEEVTVLAQAARLLGKEEEVKKYEEQADKIRAAFNSRFFDSAQGIYSTNSQTANSMPLVLGMVDPKNRQTVLAAIVKDVQDHGNSLTAGDIGYRYLLRALADNGRSDVIYAMNNQSEKPGYGMQLKRGATSLTEAWDANPKPSQNHFMLGQINEWFFHDLAGIQPSPAEPGFKRIMIKPAFVGDLTEVKAGYDSVRGKIVSEWKRNGDQIDLKIVIPPNTSATVYLPISSSAIKESGNALARADGVNLLPGEGKTSRVEVGSGTYFFSFPLARETLAP